MAEGRRASGALARLWIGLLAALVPPDLRDAWRREWHGELEASRGPAGPAPSGRPAFFRLRFLLGALPDALAVRRHAGRAGARGAPMEVLPELGRAARGLLRAPGFATTAVVTLGVGIGATVLIFALVQGILLRPLPYPEAARVVRVYHTFTDPGAAGTDWPLARFAFAIVEEEATSFEAIGGYWSPDDWTVSGEGPAERVTGVRATVGLLDVLGAEARVGRLFSAVDVPATEDQPAEGVVLGHGLWQRRWGGDEGVVGRRITLNGRAVTVMGVMAEGVALPERDIDVWMPYGVPVGTPVDDAFRIYLLGRLAAGTDPSVANAEIDRLVARFPGLAPWWTILLDDMGMRSHVRPLREEVVGGIERSLWILQGAVAIVLLVALANVANLVLIRAESRGREVAVRAALGAGRGHLLAHFGAESLIVTGAAALVGVGLATLGVRALVRLAPPSLPRVDELEVGVPVAALAALLSVALAAVLALYPWLRARRTSGALGARPSKGRGSPRSARFGDGLLVAQVALALVLLSASALLLESFQRLRAVDPGFRAEGVLVAELGLSAGGYAASGEVDAFLRALVERAEALPGVRRAAIGPSPLRSDLGCSGLFVEGRVLREGEFPPCVPMAFVGPGYWEVLGVPLLAGRGVETSDASSLPVVVVTENLAGRLWPEGGPLTGAVHPAPRTGPPWYPVVGVAGAVRGRGPAEPPTEVLYLPAVSALEGSEGGAFPSVTGLLVAAEPGGELLLAPALRRLVAELNPNATLTVEGTLGAELSRSMVRTSFTLILLGTAGLTALALGLVGLYGAVAHRVASRRGEIGVRMALGASAAGVRALVLGETLRLVLLGTGLGVLGALTLTRVLESLLFEVEPGDPRMLALAVTTLLATAFLASWIPARRVTRVDPVEALRAD